MNLSGNSLHGILPVLPTPLGRAGEVDSEALIRLVEFALDAGVSGLVYPGFASEVSELSVLERNSMLETVVRAVRGSIPVVAGASANSARDVISHGLHAQSLGVVYLMVQPPLSLGTSLDQNLGYLAEVCDALPNMKIVLQNAPSPRGSDLAPEVIRDIAGSLPQIAYVKEETLPAGPSISHLVANRPASLMGVIGGGGARYILDEYDRGACAAMPALEIADLHVKMDKYWRHGRKGEARNIYVSTLPLLALQAVYRMRLTKFVLMRRGILKEVGVRAATPELDDAAIRDIDANLAELGLIVAESKTRNKHKMGDNVKAVQVFSLTQHRETPYLGAARPGEEPNSKGYLVRKGNRTVYPVFDRSILVRIETTSGEAGWGETYGIVAPGAVAEIIKDLLTDFVVGRDPSDPSAIYDDLYDLMRVRGYTGGFYVDALAAIDIALWDIAGKLAGQSVAELLGGSIRRKVPAYVSGLPEPTLAERIKLARTWQDKGFNDFKFAAPVADDGPVSELRALREALGEEARIAVDLHWVLQAEEAIDLIRDMKPLGLWFAEAPVRTEDIKGLEAVCRCSDVAIAVGEEWRTHWDFLHRVDRCEIKIVQPEMGHKGITNFTRICRLAGEHGIEVVPHATIGAGIFLAASLQASAALDIVSCHEFQHSIFEPNRRFVNGDMDCAAGFYTPPRGPGLGVYPSEEALRLLKPI